MASTRAQGLAPWSASKIQTALRCPRLFHYRYVEKLAEPEVMPETRIGKAVHTTLELALSGKDLGEALSEGAKTLENEDERHRFDRLCKKVPEFLTRVEGFRKARGVQRQLIEYAIAIREDLSATPFYSAGAYFRGIVDAAYRYGDGIVALVDHKSGLRQPNFNITEQLEGYAVLASQYFRGVRQVWLGVHWVGDGIIDWGRPLEPTEIRERLIPKVFANIEAAALAVDDGPRPQTSPWCERCSYRSVCPAGREMRFEPVDDDPDPGLV